MRLNKYYFLFFVFGCLMIFISGCTTIDYTRVDRIPTRENVTVDLGIYEPKNMQPVKGIVLMLPGGGGQASGLGYPMKMINVFNDRGYILAIMDLPSGMWNMPVKFRMDFDHQLDIKKTVEYLRNKYLKKHLYLCGFSNGCISVGWYHMAHDDVADLAGIVIMGGGWKWVFDHDMINNFIDMPYPDRKSVV
jgi:poly(3-hydroxybutyrate) depolymerase